MNEYEGVRRINYKGGACFVPVCKKCGRFVKADKEVFITGLDERLVKQPNATCSRCGRTLMLFEGFY